MSMSNQPREMSFLEHLEELRWRLVKSVGAVLVFSIITYFFTDQIIDFITRPIDQVYFTSPTEAFGVRIKLSLFTGLIVGLPVIFYQIWQFVVPGLHRHETRLVIPITILATLFFLIGASFCFFLVMPIGMTFLLGFGTAKLKPLISIGEYVSFVGWMTLGFGAVFELPIISYFLGRLGIIQSSMLRRGRRWAIVIILIVAGAITPSPDMFSQVLLAGPLYILYEISILIVRFTGRRG